MIKLISVYRYKDKILLHASIPTTNGGPLIVSPPFRVLEETASSTELGLLVFDILRNYPSVPVKFETVDFKLVGAPLLELAKVKSYRKLASNSQMCHLTESDDSVTIVPLHRDGGGFVASKEDTKSAARLPLTASAEEIGRSLIETLDRS
jgi:hypothetical protein